MMMCSMGRLGTWMGKWGGESLCTRISSSPSSSSPSSSAIGIATDCS